MNVYNQNRANSGYSPGAMPGTGSLSGVDRTVTTLALLAAIPTVNAVVPVVKVWVEEATGTTQVWRLLAGTTATGDGVQRPDDWASSGKVWYKASS